MAELKAVEQSLTKVEPKQVEKALENVADILKNCVPDKLTIAKAGMIEALSSLTELAIEMRSMFLRGTNNGILRVKYEKLSWLLECLSENKTIKKVKIQDSNLAQHGNGFIGELYKCRQITQLLVLNCTNLDPWEIFKNSSLIKEVVISNCNWLISAQQGEIISSIQKITIKDNYLGNVNGIPNVLSIGNSDGYKFWRMLKRINFEKLKTLECVYRKVDTKVPMNAGAVIGIIENDISLNKFSLNLENKSVLISLSIADFKEQIDEIIEFVGKYNVSSLDVLLRAPKKSLFVSQEFADHLENLLNKNINIKKYNGCISSVLESYFLRDEIIDKLLARNVFKANEFLLAVKFGNYALVRERLEEGVDVNNVDPEGNTALHYAAQQGHLEIIQLLCGEGGQKWGQEVEFDLTNSENKTALQLAEQNGHKAVVEYLTACKQLSINTQNQVVSIPNQNISDNNNDIVLKEKVIEAVATEIINYMLQMRITWEKHKEMLEDALLSSESYQQVRKFLENHPQLPFFVIDLIQECEEKDNWSKILNNSNKPELVKILNEAIILAFENWCERPYVTLKQTQNSKYRVVVTRQNNLPQIVEKKRIDATVFNVELRKLLSVLKEKDIALIISDAADAKQGTLGKTLSCFLNSYLPDQPSKLAVESLSVDKVCKFVQYVNWLRFSSTLGKQVLSTVGFAVEVNWQDALSEEGKDIFNAFEKIKEYFDSFQSATGGYSDQLVIELLKNRGLQETIIAYKETLVQLILSSRIPEFKEKNIEKLIEVLIEVQSYVIDNKGDTVMQIFAELICTEEEKIDRWSAQLIKFIKTIPKVIQVYAEPMAASMPNFIFNDVNRLLCEARDKLPLTAKSKDLAFPSKIDKKDRVNCAKIFKEYADKRLGPLNTTETARQQVIRDLDLHGMRFRSDIPHNTYDLSWFYFQGFKFNRSHFEDCTFADSIMHECTFEEAIFHGVVDLSNLEVDVATAKTLTKALAESLAGHHIVEIRGQLKLTGDYLEVEIPISVQYLDTSHAKNLQPLVIEQAAEESVSPSQSINEQALASTSDSDQVTAQVNPGFLGNFYNAAAYIQPATKLVRQGLNCMKEMAEQGLAKVDEKLRGQFDHEKFTEQYISDLKDAVEQEIAKLKKESSANGAVIAVQHERITQLESAVNKLEVLRKDKEKIRDQRKELLENKGTKVANYYRTCFTMLCAALHSIFLLNSDFLQAKTGTSRDYANNLSTLESGASVGLSALSKADMVVKKLPDAADFIAKAGEKIGSTALKLCSSKLMEITEKVPGLGIITGTVKAASDFTANVLDKHVRVKGQKKLWGSPKMLEAMAEDFARAASFLYEEPITITSEKGASNFAEYTVIRVLTGLFNEMISDECFVEDALIFIRTHQMSIAQCQIEFLQMKFGIPFREGRVEKEDKNSISEDILHRRTGCYVEVQERRSYYSNDAKILKGEKFVMQLPDKEQTFAIEVGYIKVNERPRNMTPDDYKRGPQLISSAKHKNKQPKASAQSVPLLPSSQSNNTNSSGHNNSKQSNTGNEVKELKEKLANLEKENTEMRNQISGLQEKADKAEKVVQAFDKFRSSTASSEEKILKAMKKHETEEKLNLLDSNKKSHRKMISESLQSTAKNNKNKKSLVNNSNNNNNKKREQLDRLSHKSAIESGFYATKNSDLEFSSNRSICLDFPTTIKLANSDIVFERSEVSADGKCGYTAFCIERENAYKLLKSNLQKIIHLLQHAIKEELLKGDFINYLRDKTLLSVDLNQAYVNYQRSESGEAEELKNFANNLIIADYYLDYDVRDEEIDDGWSHPCVLQALAEIQGIKLYLYVEDEAGNAVPHNDYPHHTPINATQTTRLLFVNGNHFERLEESEYRPQPTQQQSA